MLVTLLSLETRTENPFCTRRYRTLIVDLRAVKYYWYRFDCYIGLKEKRGDHGMATASIRIPFDLVFQFGGNCYDCFAKLDFHDLMSYPTKVLIHSFLQIRFAK